MPLIYDYKCNKCGFTLPSGWGYSFYVIDHRGDRIECLHPAERKYVEEVLGIRAAQDLEYVRKMTGFNSYCICLDCLYEFVADLGETGWSPYDGYTSDPTLFHRNARDKRECPKCNSLNVKTLLELKNQICPSCKVGIIEAIWTFSVS